MNFYNNKKKAIHSNNLTAKDKLIKLKSILETEGSINGILNKVYPLLCDYYIPKCYIFSNNKIIEYSFSTSNIVSNTENKLTPTIFYNYPFTQIDSIVHFYDSKIPSGIVFNKNKYFRYIQNSSEIESNLIKLIYPKLWKINLNYLNSFNKKMYSITLASLNKLQLPSGPQNTKWFIKIKIYFIKNTKSIFINEFETSHTYQENRSTQSELINIDPLLFQTNSTKIHYNTQDNPKIKFVFTLSQYADILITESTIIPLKKFNENILKSTNNTTNINFNLMGNESWIELLKNNDPWKTSLIKSDSPQELLITLVNSLKNAELVIKL